MTINPSQDGPWPWPVATKREVGKCISSVLTLSLLIKRRNFCLRPQMRKNSSIPLIDMIWQILVILRVTRVVSNRIRCRSYVCYSEWCDMQVRSLNFTRIFHQGAKQFLPSPEDLAYLYIFITIEHFCEYILSYLEYTRLYSIVVNIIYLNWLSFQ